MLKTFSIIAALALIAVLGMPADAQSPPAWARAETSDLALALAQNVLVGGSARTFALQPVSLEGSIAVDVALGVSALKLRPVF
jgi:hypothetical protein